ncbi:hypothetical protein ACFPC0_11035 [Streptomyces andamanensis]|uniref:Uncharacterized protein n=1 Tax=Streptomyces andamanensis TaxID=1565035 RepID=A0ABV8TCK7_9ACTN
MTEQHPGAPERFKVPGRLTQVPAWAMTKAITNALQVTGDSDQAEEVVRRVLAALKLAGPEMPEAPTLTRPDGERMVDAPLPTAIMYQCGWGYLSQEGDLRMCVLAEADDEGQVRGHDKPGEHQASAVTGDFDLTFMETDGRAFYAPAWKDGQG